ncbi:hypothetical protein SCA6_004178 [Theobroma cacao]
MGSNEEVMVTAEPSVQDGSFMVRGRALFSDVPGDPDVQTTKLTEPVFINSGDNPFKLMRDSIKILEKHKGTFRHIENKQSDHFTAEFHGAARALSGSAVLLKIWNLNKLSGVIGVFNCQRAGVWPPVRGSIYYPVPGSGTPISGCVSALDADSLEEVAGIMPASNLKQSTQKNEA